MERVFPRTMFRTIASSTVEQSEEVRHVEAFARQKKDFITVVWKLIEHHAILNSWTVYHSMSSLKPFPVKHPSRNTTSSKMDGFLLKTDSTFPPSSRINISVVDAVDVILTSPVDGWAIKLRYLPPSNSGRRKKAELYKVDEART